MKARLLPVLVLFAACAGQKSGTTPDSDGSGPQGDQDGDGYDTDDCDDGDPSVYPGADEVCDGADDDCDGQTDEGLLSTWYGDADGDGYGDGGAPVSACAQPDDTVASATDCDDGDPGVFPGATEVCNGVDDDCDGAIDDDDGNLELSTASTGYADADDDGYGDPDQAYVACVLPDGCSLNALDCDDTDASVYTGATEICDGIDDDCDGLVDLDDDSLEDGQIVYTDSDGDGWGAGEGTLSCEVEEGTALLGGDCDDDDDGVNPDASEICDDIDDDCDDLIDDDDPTLDTSTGATWYPDVDEDGFGAADLGASSCQCPDGWVADATDCDDGDGGVNPDASEICDDIDDDCDDLVDDDDDSLTGDYTIYADEDGDGFGAGDAIAACAVPDDHSLLDTDCDDTAVAIYPGAEELCDDDTDNDCDGEVDEDCGPSCADLSIIVWYDTYTKTNVPAYAASRLLGLTPSASGSASTFATLYDAGAWDVLVIDSPGDLLPTGVVDRLSDAIDAGTVVLFSSWHLTYDDDIQDLLQVSVDSSFTVPKPLSAGTDDSLWSIWQTLPKSISTATPDAGIDGAILSPTDSSTTTTLAFYDVGTTKEAILATYSGQVLVNGFSTWPFARTDDDGDSVYDMVELFANEIVWTTDCSP